MVILLFLCILISLIFYLIKAKKRTKATDENIYNKHNKIDSYRDIKLNKCFYTIDQLGYNFLKKVHLNFGQICKEVNNLKKTAWYDWPEKNLFYKNTQWTIFPFFGFNHYSKNNILNCPILAQFLHSIPKIKLATLSKMGPKSKLKQHQGWGEYSNNVIRCHYGIDVPDGCFMHVFNGVEYEKKQVKNNEWTIFDDSKMHYASNTSNNYRIVLIVDIERPPHVENGKSTYNDTNELVNFIQQF